MATSSKASGSSVWDAPQVYKHHEQQRVCYTRPKYRDGRRARAVKVYTINLESRFLLVQGVPAIGVMTELVQLFALYGVIEEYRVLDEYPAEQFTEVYLIKFQKLTNARAAKRKTDEKSFYGGQLHVCYAPEYETVEDTRKKLQDRKRYVNKASQKPAETKHNQEQPEESTTSAFGESAQSSAALEDKEHYNRIHEESSNFTSDFPSPLLPLPPWEEAAQQHQFPKGSFTSRSVQRSVTSVPTEDRMGSLHNFVPSAPDLPKQTSNFPKRTSSGYEEKEQSHKHKGPATTVPRFIPRTTHLENRKRKCEDSSDLMGVTDKNAPLFGPKLPELPKTDMEDDSLNITANLIRQTMAKVGSASTERKTTTTKKRRRI